MSGIEWQETKEYKPVEKSIKKFCQEKNIAPEQINRISGLVSFIESRALEGLHDYLAHDLKREHGGVLVGQPFFDCEENRYFIDIRAAIPALETEGNEVHLQFTPQSWSYISGIIEENFPDQVILGWFHSHPGLGVFMSGTDRATQSAFFRSPWNVAIVVDPVAKKTGWFSSSQCEPMDRNHVIAYENPALENSFEREPLPPSTVPTENMPSTSWRKLGWLLPFAGVMIVAGVAGIWFMKRKNHNRSA
jgi:proteasome lid subunit RPN8/RPN11